MKRLKKDDGIIIADVNWAATTAGPSLYKNNERVEVFLLGCNKAAEGNPCKGCFNDKLWYNNIAEFSLDPIEVAEKINKISKNKYITIGGGEPLDQEDKLYILCKKLKEYGFHIIMYTWRDNEYVINSKISEVIDVAITGEYIEKLRIYNIDSNDGTTNSIGSSNQCVFDIKNNRYEFLYNIKKIELDKNNNIIFIRKDGNYA